MIAISKMIVRHCGHFIIGHPRLTMHEMFIMQHNDFRRAANYSWVANNI